MRIDSHQHFWKISRGDYSWMKPEMKVLHRDYLPGDLKPSLESYKIDKTILVSAAPTLAETDFLLDLAKKHDFIAGVVGWLDLESKDFPSLIELYSRQHKFAGLRPMLESLPDNDWILRPPVMDSLRIIAQLDLPFDFLVYTRHLPHVAKVLEEVPGLRAVIDHIAKPEIKAQKLEPWKSLIRDVAQHKNLYCKLSGMVTEADHDSWNPEQLRPYIEHVVECFGPERVMFGSDWPVCLLAGSYDQVVGVLETVLNPVVDAASLQAVYGDNAARFYKLKD
ncbi:MAG: amidohydrolase family protein [Acidobacteriota bacterium]